MLGGIAVSTAIPPNIYVTEYDNHRVQKFSSTGTYLDKFGTLGSGDSQFNFIQGIAVDSAGNIYVADNFNDRVRHLNQMSQTDNRMCRFQKNQHLYVHPNQTSIGILQ